MTKIVFLLAVAFQLVVGMTALAAPSQAEMEQLRQARLEMDGLYRASGIVVQPGVLILDNLKTILILLARTSGPYSYNLEEMKRRARYFIDELATTTDIQDAFDFVHTISGFSHEVFNTDAYKEIDMLEIRSFMLTTLTNAVASTVRNSNFSPIAKNYFLQDMRESLRWLLYMKVNDSPEHIIGYILDSSVDQSRYLEQLNKTWSGTALRRPARSAFALYCESIFGK